MTKRAVPISTFVEQLCAIPVHEFSLAQVFGFLRSHPVGPDSLEPYVYFKRNAYTRNLIYKNELFELLALCWDAGKTSHIHNHCGQSCWMATPVGRLLVQNYRIVVGCETDSHCELEPSTSFWMDSSNPGMVDPEEPIHSVGAPPDARAVSLHIYSRPYDRCMVYSLEKTEAWEISLSYDSEYGARVAC
ncbi:MAG: cysteine dioxygenase [Gammaproteobacteria bacterium]|nr:cysteine dioxygenase [Gammaproteobacteria bacterium]NIR84906.1 cysteine dioxygenase [Gammaproteobacteria bacterium]NIR91755.1 cysteine dioxygenase [Gammaproteobacteria bacterium]NIU05953.1 cysteine dioxygenase [Gammaproteobacteria bacterium]NIV53000.1 cysteine dioxygenase [Gammaproteobacteria bacterium]